ncbi:MAG: hypothetical protein EZS28_027654, partial [Streblomastix strix]
MDHASEYNINGGLLGLGEYSLLEVIFEMKLPQNVQQFLGVNKKLYKLKYHPRFMSIIQSITQIIPIFIIKDECQGYAVENKFIHSDKNERFAIAIDPIISEGIVKIEIIFGNSGGYQSIGIADASCSFAAGKGPQNEG